MKRPDNLFEALKDIQYCMLGIAQEIDESAPDDESSRERIKQAALDTHLLVTWIKDNFKEMQK
jgi:hypothetical protein